MPQPDPPPRQAPRTPYESMAIVVGPGVKGVAQSIARRYAHVRERGVPTLTQEDLQDDSELLEFLHAYARSAMACGATRSQAILDANLLAVHLHYAANHELHNRKTFWVDPPLAWMLARTDLDIDGELLRLPFPACAFIWNDPDMLAMRDALVALDDAIRDKLPVKAVSVYSVETPASDAQRGLRACVLLDYLQDDRWPYMLVRDLCVAQRMRLDAVLESHFAGVDPVKRDAVFTSPEFKRLLRLAINGVLYATSADVPIVRRSPPAATFGSGLSSRQLKRRRRELRANAMLRGEEVFFLPGKIHIRRLQELTEHEEREPGHRLMARFAVRGHWRRANPGWTDQRQRWIEPFWKGPEMAAVIERDYRIREVP